MKDLMLLAPGTRKHLVAVVALKWLGLLATIFIMFRLGWAFQTVLSGAQEVPAALLWQVLAAACARAACGLAAQRAGDRAALTAKTQVRDAVIAKLLRLGPSYQEHAASAQAMQLAVEGAEQLEVYFGAFLPQIFFAVLAPVTLFAALARTCLPAALIMVCGVVLVPGLIFGVRKAARVAARVYWGSYGELGQAFLEDIQGLTTLKIFSADGARHERMNEEAQKFRSATMNLLSVQLRSIVGMDLVVYAGAAAGIVVALVQLSTGQIGFAAAFTVVFLSQEFFLPMRQLGSLFHAAMNGIAAADRMRELLDAPEPAQGTCDEVPADCTICCEHVGYSYDGTRQVLDGVDAVFPAGSFTGVVGTSGAGKSTLAGVLSGRLGAYTGRVTLGGRDVRDYTRAALAAAVTCVPANAHLFSGTVRDNLAIACPGATDEQMWDALAQAAVDGFVRAAGGLDFVLAEGAGNLSGGQRQRIAIARALLHDSPVYLFDEATSNIDVESERAVSEVIARLAKTRTVIVISHRLSLVQPADRILALEGGRVAEAGPHGRLLEAGGVYARMWESQERYERMAASWADADAEAAALEGAAAPGEEPAAAPPEAAGRPPQQALRTRTRGAFAVMGRLMGLLGALAPYMALAIGLGVVGHLAAIFLTTFGAFGLARGVGWYAGAGMMALCALVAACGVARGPLRYGEQLTNHYIAFSVLAAVRDHVYRALRRLAPAKLEGRDKGDLVSLVTGDIELLEVFYAHTISPVAIALAVGAIMCVWLALRSWQLALLALCAYVFVGVVLTWAAARATRGAGAVLREGAGRQSAFVLESLRGLRELLQFDGAHGRARQLHERTVELGRVELRHKLAGGAVAAVADVAIVAFDVAMLACAVALYRSGALVFSQALTCTCAFMASFGPAVAVMRLGSGLAGTLAAGDRVIDLLDEQPQTPDVEAGRAVPFERAAAEHVGFAYAGAPVLVDANLALEPGSVVAVEGPSGAGKSTLLKLLMRFWDVDSGRVAFDDVDVRRIATADLRAHQGYMTQETHLFSGTIGENILLARPDANLPQLRDACEKARIMDLVDALPQGFDTPVGELGDVLSGGERQRVGLARLFLQDAPFMLLDEPTSNLDALNEAAVVDALDAARAGRTIVVVSHRASTSRFADRIVHIAPPGAR